MTIFKCLLLNGCYGGIYFDSLYIKVRVIVVTAKALTGVGVSILEVTSLGHDDDDDDVVQFSCEMNLSVLFFINTQMNEEINLSIE